MSLDNFTYGVADPDPVPEPSTWVLVLGTLGALAWWQRRRKSSPAAGNPKCVPARVHSV
jgi:hypothetical protein